MRSFEIAVKMKDGKAAIEKDERGIEGVQPAYREARLPEYQTKKSAGADFFCAEEVVIPSIWKSVAKFIGGLLCKEDDETFKDVLNKSFSPTLVHTGIKASMEDDEVLLLYNRSSNPKKIGLVLSNGVGVVDADYYGNADNDGEIGFMFYNFKPWSTTIKVGDRIGQGVFQKFLRPEIGLVVKDAERTGGYGSTDKAK